MFMYVYRIFISLLLILVHCEVTVEQATHGPLRKICTFTRRDKTIAEIPPLAREDGKIEIVILFKATWPLFTFYTSLTCWRASWKPMFCQTLYKCQQVCVEFSKSSVLLETSTCVLHKNEEFAQLSWKHGICPPKDVAVKVIVIHCCLNSQLKYF